MYYTPVSTIGYYSNNYNNLHFSNCTPNIPTIPIQIGNINAIAQLDLGFDDIIHYNSININHGL